MTAYPFLIHLGRFTITGYGIMMMVAFLTAGWVLALEVARRGMDTGIAWDTVVFAVLGGLAGSKVYYAIEAGRWDALLSRGGLVWYGGLLGGALLVIGSWWWRRLTVRPLLDAVAPAMVVGYMLGRVGCFLVNDDYGLPTGLPWGIAFPRGAPPSSARMLHEVFHVTLPAGTPPEQVLAVHPTQLYEVALMFAVFAYLWRRREHQHAPGWLFGLYLVLAGAERFLVEFLRAKDDRYFGPITMAQVLSLVVLALGWWLMARLASPEAQPAPRDPVAPVQV